LKTIYHHKLKWIVKEEYQSILSTTTLDQLINLEGVKEHKIVRTLSSRTVRYLKPSSAEIPPLYLKEYHLSTPFESIKTLFLSPAEREWYNAQKITQKNASTFSPLALGKLRIFGVLKKNYLISKSIDNAKSLKEYTQDYYLSHPVCDTPEKRKLIVALAKFIKNLHQKGIFHQDFHWGNILIEKAKQGAIYFYLMDLHRVKLKSKLTNREKIKNLASLNTCFYQKARRTERLRFLKAYAEGSEQWEVNYPRFAYLIEEMTDKMLRKLWHKRGKRCVKQNKYFIPFKSSTYKGFINRDFYSPELLDLLYNPDRAFSEPVSTIIKDSHTTSSCFMPLQIAGEKFELYIKRYNYQNIFYALKNLFRTSRGKRVWKVANGFVLRTIPIPLPIAFLEQRKGGVLTKSFFITQKIDQSIPLITLFQKGLSNAPTETAKIKNELLQQVARILRRMHEQGIWHRDLKASNLLVQKKAGQKEKLYLLDLDGTRIKRKIRNKDRTKDLARLNASLLDTKTISMPDRVRFLKYYLNVRKTRDQKVREFWKAMVWHTQKKLKKAGREFV